MRDICEFIGFLLGRGEDHGHYRTYARAWILVAIVGFLMAVIGFTH